MDHNDRYLDSFFSSATQYLNEVLIEKNCVSSNLRKHSIKNNEDVEFSFLLKPILDSNCNDKKSSVKITLSNFTEEELRRFKLISESWCLHLANAIVRESKLCLKLNRFETFATIIRAILNQKSNYGKRSVIKQTIKVTLNSSKLSDLTEYRSSLLKTAAENVLKASGFKVSVEEGNKWVHFTSCLQKTQNNPSPDYVVLCGPVVNMATKQKENQIKIDDYRRICLTDLRKISRNRHHNTEDKGLLESLLDASITISLLQVKASQAVSLNLNQDQNTSGDKGKKSGVFLQYNASRLAAIRKKFLKNVREGFYSPLPEIEVVDFSLLKEPEEWALMFNFLLEFPSLVDKVSEDIIQGKANFHKICDFLIKLCSLFSIYYRRVRILLTPRNHLIQIIHARLLLLMSVEQVLENGLSIFNISKIEEM